VRVRGINWDTKNRAHFRERSQRGIDEEQVADILLQRCYPHRAATLPREPQAEPRRLIYGCTCRGRYLGVVVVPLPEQRVRPVTAWPLSDKAIENYLAWKQTVKR
jgi:uncharacterized DUF497 family protein